MTEVTTTQPPTTDQWPVLPSQTDIVVKCAALEKPTKQAEALGLQLVPALEDAKALLELQPIKLDGVELTIEEVAAKAADYLTYCSKTITVIDTRRKAYTERARNFVTDMNAEVDRYVTRIKTSKSRIEGILLRYEQKKRAAEQERLKQEKEKRDKDALDAAQKLQEQGLHESANRVIEVATSAPRRAAVRPVETRGENTGRRLGMRTTWTGSVMTLNTILQAVIDGKLSADGITVSQAWLNRIAIAHAKEEVFLGVKCEKKESLV